MYIIVSMSSLYLCHLVLRIKIYIYIGSPVALAVGYNISMLWDFFRCFFCFFAFFKLFQCFESDFEK